MAVELQFEIQFPECPNNIRTQRLTAKWGQRDRSVLNIDPSVKATFITIPADAKELELELCYIGLNGVVSESCKRVVPVSENLPPEAPAFLNVSCMGAQNVVPVVGPSEEVSILTEEEETEEEEVVTFDPLSPEYQAEVNEAVKEAKAAYEAEQKSH